MHPIPLIHEISLCVICFIKWAWKTLKKGRNVPFSLTMHPVTRIYWTAWLWQIQATQAQGKLLMHGTSLCMVLTHGWQSARVCALYAHMPCTAQTVGQWKKLARSRVLNTRPLLATSLNPFYNIQIYMLAPVAGWNCNTRSYTDCTISRGGVAPSGKWYSTYNWGGYSSNQRLVRRVYLIYIRHR